MQRCFFLLLFFCVPFFCSAQAHSVLCTDGTGTFDGALFNKVQVHVGATKQGAPAAGSCEATLTGREQTLVVATNLPALDLDAFGVDFGLGGPVAAFQLKKSKDDCCMAYVIYSVQKVPTLLRTITGGSFFAAADTDLDGRVEIWTDDAATVHSIDNLTLSELDFAPPIVLRFEKGKLLDVTSEFSPDFDKHIEKLRTQVSPKDLSEFKGGDGKLQPGSFLQAQIGHLQGVKIKALEIVWSYLYSGREQQAWSALADLWPASDVDRIREVLLKARASGMHSQLDGVSTAAPVKRKVVEVFTPVTSSSTEMTQRLESSHPLAVDESQGPELVSAPVPIMARSSPTVVPDQSLAQGEMTVTVVIDSAGKVHSVQPMGTTEWKNVDLMSALSEWKFVPAFRGHRAVASSIVKIFSP
jgi:hypothetical protein